MTNCFLRSESVAVDDVHYYRTTMSATWKLLRAALNDYMYVRHLMKIKIK